MTDDQKTTLWLGAFRYYCGRMTYAVSAFCEVLISAWEDLPEETRLLIQRDLETEFWHDNEERKKDPKNKRSYKRLGQDIDRAEWEKVRKLWTDAP